MWFYNICLTVWLFDLGNRLRTWGVTRRLHRFFDFVSIYDLRIFDDATQGLDRRLYGWSAFFILESFDWVTAYVPEGLPVVCIDVSTVDLYFGAILAYCLTDFEYIFVENMFCSSRSFQETLQEPRDGAWEPTYFSHMFNIFLLKNMLCSSRSFQGTLQEPLDGAWEPTYFSDMFNIFLIYFCWKICCVLPEASRAPCRNL